MMQALPQPAMRNVPTLVVHVPCPYCYPTFQAGLLQAGLLQSDFNGEFSVYCPRCMAGTKTFKNPRKALFRFYRQFKPMMSNVIVWSESPA